MSEIAITQSANPAGENVPHPTSENPLQNLALSPLPGQLAGDLIDSLIHTVEAAEKESRQ